MSSPPTVPPAIKKLAAAQRAVPPLQEERHATNQGVMQPKLAQMAVELAARLEPSRTVIDRYGVQPAELKALLGNPVFRKMLKEAQERFQSASATPERIMLKAQLLIEVGLEEMHDIMVDDTLSPAARVQAFTAIRALSGLEKPGEQAIGAKFEFSIVLPAQGPAAPEHITISGTIPGSIPSPPEISDNQSDAEDEHDDPPYEPQEEHP